jgi:Concanavalin A-like lectin/glucanases superfamily
MLVQRFLAMTLIGLLPLSISRAADDGLIAHWKLEGDCQDLSGKQHHGQNHNVDLATSSFNGRDAYIEVTNSTSLQIGDEDFSVAADVWTGKDLRGAFGTIVSKFDPACRRGFELALCTNSSGYNAQSDNRQLFLGTDDGTNGTWTDCGRPNERTHISDSLTVFKGDLYAGSTDGPDVTDWAHVYRYGGGKKWEDCGRLGTDRTRGVYAMVVHDGELYAATSASHGGQPPEMSFGRVYRYKGGQKWDEIGQPGENYRLNSLASYKGKLYATGFNIGPKPGHVYVWAGERNWKACGEFNGWPHPLAVHAGRLYTAYPQGEVYAYDGADWENLGNPLSTIDECNQIHSLGVYQGELYIGSWPKGKVAVWRDNKWIDLGQLGDATEVIGLTVYNGSLFGGTIPRAELFRLDGPGKWSSVRRLFDPPGFEPVTVGSGARAVQDWSRASSLTVYQGKLFVSTATCYRTLIDPPQDGGMRGKVFSFQTGSCVSADRDLGDDWKHVAAVRCGKELRLFVDGAQVASATRDGPSLDMSSDAPLRLGFGPQGYFDGKIREVRLYNRALNEDEVKAFCTSAVDKTTAISRANEFKSSEKQQCVTQ